MHTRLASMHVLKGLPIFKFFNKTGQKMVLQRSSTMNENKRSLGTSQDVQAQKYKGSNSMEIQAKPFSETVMAQ